MDSLLANYASSDDDEEPPKQQSETTPSSLFSALASPSSSSLFSSLPPPDKPQTFLPINTFNKRQIFEHEEEEEGIAIPKPGIKPSSSLFSSLPRPKSLSQQQPISNLSPLDPNPKRVVQFKPPAPPKPFDFDEDDDKVEEEKERKRRRESEFAAQSSSVKSFLSSIPAPRNSSTLGVLPSGSGSGRRSIIENEGLSSVSDLGFENGPGVEQNAEGFVGYDGDFTGYQQPGFDQSGGGYVNYGSYGGYETGVIQSGNAGDVSGCCSYEGYGSFGDHGQYGGTWGDGSVAAVPQTSEPVGSAMIFPRKRGKRDVPTEIVEVKQEDLTKDRPREDQTKLTGIAFGPSYQPASTKGKPSKLHKRKHQIGSLYYDMKQKEMELTERRAQGFLTKAQTQGKYGW